MTLLDLEANKGLCMYVGMKDCVLREWEWTGICLQYQEMRLKRATDGNCCAEVSFWVWTLMSLNSKLESAKVVGKLGQNNQPMSRRHLEQCNLFE